MWCALPSCRPESIINSACFFIPKRPPEDNPIVVSFNFSTVENWADPSLIESPLPPVAGMEGKLSSSLYITSHKVGTSQAVLGNHRAAVELRSMKEHPLIPQQAIECPLRVELIQRNVLHKNRE